MARPSAPGVVKDCEASRDAVTGESQPSGSGRRCESAWSKGTVPIDLQAPKRSSWTTKSESQRSWTCRSQWQRRAGGPRALSDD